MALAAALLSGTQSAMLSKLGNRVHATSTLLTMGLSTSIIGTILMLIFNF